MKGLGAGTVARVAAVLPSDTALLGLADPYYEATGTAPFFHPGADSPEIEYMLERRSQLGGSIPKREDRSTMLTLPGDSVYAIAAALVDGDDRRIVDDAGGSPQAPGTRGGPQVLADAR